MKLTKLFVGAFALSAMLVACGDDSTSAKDTEIEELSSSSAVEIASSSSTTRNDSSSSSVMETSSSSAIKIASSSSTTRNDSSSSSAMETSSSSAVEIASSSSTIRNDGLSSSAIESSSSSVMESSSSSETTQSSSSITTATPCNVDGESNCVYGTLTDTRDGQTYKTVTIGDQTWMAENLNYAYTGVPYKVIGSYAYTSDSTSWCYENDPVNCTKYGRLYTWATAIDSVSLVNDVNNPQSCGSGKTCTLPTTVQGICPSGWHLPSKTEFEALITAVGGSSTAGAKLKSQTGWTAYDGITNEDAFGFSALPAGRKFNSEVYYFEGINAFFWSSTERGSDKAYFLNLFYATDYAFLDNLSKDYGFSVRCVKD